MDHNNRVKHFFQAIDSMDANEFSSFLTDDASFRFGNVEAVSGKAAVKESMEGFFASIGGLSHDVQAIVQNDGVLMCKGEVTLTRKDKTSVTLPFANFLGLENDLVKEFQIYIDISPLYSPSGK